VLSDPWTADGGKETRQVAGATAPRHFYFDVHVAMAVGSGPHVHGRRACLPDGEKDERRERASQAYSIDDQLACAVADFTDDLHVTVAAEVSRLGERIAEELAGLGALDDQRE